jgi:flagellar biosynthesis protein FliQ
VRNDTRQRLILAFALGVAASVTAVIFNVPGRGEFIVAGWLAGIVAGMVAGGWRQLAAVLAGVVVGLAVVPILGRSLTFLPLIAAVLGALAAHGWVAAAVVDRLRREGLSAARTPPVIGAIAFLLVTLAAAAWLALELRANPI